MNIIINADDCGQSVRTNTSLRCFVSKGRLLIEEIN